MSGSITLLGYALAIAGYGALTFSLLFLGLRQPRSTMSEGEGPPPADEVARIPARRTGARLRVRLARLPRLPRPLPPSGKHLG